MRLKVCSTIGMLFINHLPTPCFLSCLSILQ